MSIPEHGELAGFSVRDRLSSGENPRTDRGRLDVRGSEYGVVVQTIHQLSSQIAAYAMEPDLNKPVFVEQDTKICRTYKREKKK
jgi:hypothetical protein